MRGTRLATTQQPRKGAEKQDPAAKLRLRLWLERGIFLVIIALLAFLYLGRFPDGRRVCLVSVDGDPVAVLATRAEAERLLEDVKATSGLPPKDLGFAQTVTLHSVSAAHNPVQSDSEAMEALRSRLEMVVPAAAILANEELVIALPNQGEAVRTLSLLLTELAPPGPNATVFFREKVRVEVRNVPPDRLVGSPEEATRKIAAEASPRTEHEVKRGESAWKIAEQYNVTLKRLAHVNPDLDLNILRAGAKLKIPGRLPPITVVARKEIEEEVVEGIYRRTRKVRITYENGMEVKREVIGGRRAVLSVPAPRDRDPWRWRDERAQ